MNIREIEFSWHFVPTCGVTRDRRFINGITGLKAIRFRRVLRSSAVYLLGVVLPTLLVPGAAAALAFFALALAPISANAASGDLFVSNFLDGTISRFTPGGLQSTFASGLNSPSGLAFDKAGNLFEADSGSNSILRITPNGTKTIFASGLNFPRGLAFDTAGDLFEADSGSNSIFKFTLGGTKSTFASGLNQPVGLANLPEPGFNDLLFEADGDGVFLFNSIGTKSVVRSGLGTAFGPRGVALDSATNLYWTDILVNNGSGGRIIKTPDGSNLNTFASGLSNPFGLAFDSTGHLFVADFGNGSVFKYAADGTRSTFASGLSGGPEFLAFQAVPEPSTLVQLCAGVTFLITGRSLQKRKGGKK